VVSTSARNAKPAAGPQKGRSRQKLRTRRQILAAASALVAAGRRPNVAEAADAADVSRRTAYRYFPTRAKLLAEATLEALRVPMEAALAEAPGGATSRDVETRVVALIDQMQALAISHEPLLRTMIHETVLDNARAAQPRRGTRRIDWIELATKPLHARLGAKAYGRLVSALALCSGIEALLVLRDIRGLSERDAIAVSRWAALAMVRQSLAELSAARRAAGGHRRASGASLSSRRTRAR